MLYKWQHRETVGYTEAVFLSDISTNYLGSFYPFEHLCDQNLILSMCLLGILGVSFILIFNTSAWVSFLFLTHQQTWWHDKVLWWKREKMSFPSEHSCDQNSILSMCLLGILGESFILIFDTSANLVTWQSIMMKKREDEFPSWTFMRSNFDIINMFVRHSWWGFHSYFWHISKPDEMTKCYDEKERKWVPSRWNPLRTISNILEVKLYWQHFVPSPSAGNRVKLHYEHFISQSYAKLKYCGILFHALLTLHCCLAIASSHPQRIACSEKSY